MDFFIKIHTRNYIVSNNFPTSFLIECVSTICFQNIYSCYYNLQKNGLFNFEIHRIQQIFLVDLNSALGPYNAVTSPNSP